MSGISTHILDLTLGRPAADVSVRLERFEFDRWTEIASRQTDAAGRCDEIIPANDASPGSYRLIFQTAGYMDSSLYSEIIVSFLVQPGSADYHLPLLLSPHGYTTYRGS